MKSIRSTTILTTLLLLITSVHHAYGAIVYHSPWRLHILFISIPLIGLIILLDYLYTGSKYQKSKAVLVSYCCAVILFPVLVIGFYEGVYNHLIKNIVYPLTGNSAAFKTMFPPPVYEIPADLWFEISGILQALILYPLVNSIRKIAR